MQAVRCTRAGSRRPLAPGNPRKVLGGRGRVGARCAKREENEARAQERPRPSRRWRALRSGAATAAIGRAAIESRARTDGTAFAVCPAAAGAPRTRRRSRDAAAATGTPVAGPAPATLVHAFCLRAAGLAAAGSAGPPPPPLPPPLPRHRCRRYRAAAARDRRRTTGRPHSRHRCRCRAAAARDRRRTTGRPHSRHRCRCRAAAAPALPGAHWKTRRGRGRHVAASPNTRAGSGRRH